MMTQTSSSVYERYKADTAQIADWLGHAALNLGFSWRGMKREWGDLPPLPKPSQPDGGGRTVKQLRNARKKASAKAKSKAARGIKGEGTGDQEKQENGRAPTKQEVRDPAKEGVFTLSVSDYLEIARFLTSKGTAIPVELVRLLERCIELRERFCGLVPNLKEVNEGGHEFFVQALKEIVRLFQPLCKRDAEEQVDDVANELRHTAIHDAAPPNRFMPLSESLDGDDVDEDFDDIYIPPPPGGRGRASFNIAMDVDEAYTQINAFFSQIHKLRDSIITAWLNYGEGRTHLVTAALVTNTALELLQKPHARLVERAFPFFCKPNTPMTASVLLVLITMFQVNRRSEPLPVFVPQIFKLKGGDRKSDLAEYFLTGHYELLCMLAEGRCGDIKVVEFVDWRPDGRRDFQSRWMQNLLLMCETLQYYHHLAKSEFIRTVHPIEPEGTAYLCDQIVRVIRDVKETKQVSLYSMFCLKVFFDIHDVMRSHISDSACYMQHACIPLLRPFDALKETHDRARDFRLDVWTDHDETVWPNFARSGGFYAHCDIFDHAISMAGHTRPTWAMQCSPMLCGISLFKVLRDRQRHALWVVNKWSSLPAAAQLYVGVQRNLAALGEPSLPEWPDLQQVIDTHEAVIFSGPVPTTVESSYESCMRMRGYKSETVRYLTQLARRAPVSQARLKRVKEDLGNPADWLDMLEETPLLTLIGRHYDSTAPADEANIGHITPHLGDLHHRATTCGEAIDGDTRATGSFKRNRRPIKASNLTSSQLLETLERNIELELPRLRFDYLTMHARCLGLLLSVRESVDEYMKTYETKRWPGTRTNPVWMVSEVLRAADTGHEGPTSGPKRVERELRLQMIRQVAEVFRKDMAEHEGSERCLI